MLTLLTFPGHGRFPSLSPFCLKAMCLLEMSGQVWVPSYVSDPSKMPCGRLPVLRTSEALIPDSDAIQAWLQTRGAGFDAGLDRAETAHAHALVTMAEEGLRHGLAHDRWLRADCWPATRKAFFGALPAPVRGPVAAHARRQIRRMLELQGTALFSESARLGRMGRDLDAVRATLGEKPYLFGDGPGTADAAIVPVLDMIRDLPCETGLREMVRGDANLVAWIDRTAAAVYPSFPS
ncbi:Tom37 metaxin N-terminal-like domain-containing protein [Roseovarius salis]|uniref:glutathione S-transferase family protein n=1 Tax=Roseovarius salis TaxID=3376063 RepID=UPI0037C85ED4